HRPGEEFERKPMQAPSSTPGNEREGAGRAAQGIAPIEYLFGPGDPPAQASGPSPDAIHYERGSLIYATDGPVGTLRQIVIDEEMAEVKALVVRLAAKKESVLVPPELVAKSAGAGLLLNVTREQFA